MLHTFGKRTGESIYSYRSIKMTYVELLHYSMTKKWLKLVTIVLSMKRKEKMVLVWVISTFSKVFNETLNEKKATWRIK